MLLGFKKLRRYRADAQEVARNLALFPAFYRDNKVWPPSSATVNVLHLCHGKTHSICLEKQIDYASPRMEAYTVDADADVKPDHLCDLESSTALAGVSPGSIAVIVFHYCRCHTESILKKPALLDRLTTILHPNGLLVMRNATTLIATKLLQSHFKTTEFTDERNNPAFLRLPTDLRMKDPMFRKLTPVERAEAAEAEAEVAAKEAVAKEATAKVERKANNAAAAAASSSCSFPSSPKRHSCWPHLSGGVDDSGDGNESDSSMMIVRGHDHQHPHHSHGDVAARDLQAEIHASSRRGSLGPLLD